MVLVNNTLVQIKPLDRSSSGKVFICYLFIEEPLRSFSDSQTDLRCELHHTVN